MRGIDMARKIQTSTEVKQRWENNNYAKYTVRLRYDTDKELIDYIEKHKGGIGTTEIFREALDEDLYNHCL